MTPSPRIFKRSGAHLAFLISILIIGAYASSTDRNMTAESTTESEIPLEEDRNEEVKEKKKPPITTPFDYEDSEGELHVISNFQEEYYFNRIHTARLGGSTGLTVYWVNLFVGSPPQRQSAIIDTGSHMLAFPCSTCGTHCGNHLNKFFNLTESLTAQKMACNAQFEEYRCNKCSPSDNVCSWGVSYMEGSSINGFMAVDYVVLGDEIQDYLDAKKAKTLTKEMELKYLQFLHHEQVQIPFGCTTTETHLFKSQLPDGIIGLGPASNTRNNPPSIIDQIFATHRRNQEQLVFSLCLNSVEGGFMSIGGYNHELHVKDAPTKIISYRENSSFYDVTVSGIGGKQLSVKVPNPIIDSGTTLVFGPPSFINPLSEELMSLCRQATQYKCGYAKRRADFLKNKFLYEASEEFPTVQSFLDSFPVFEFEFVSGSGKVIIEWKASGYLFVDQPSKSPNLYQMGFESYSTSKVYLGTPFLKNYDILFDKNKHQIHFTESTCSLPHINSVLMNTHTEKIRLTRDDDQFITELESFQKTFNLTTPNFVNRTTPNPKYDGDKDIDNKEEDINQPNQKTLGDQEKGINFSHVVVLIVISAIIGYFIRRNKKAIVVETPISYQKTSLQDFEQIDRKDITINIEDKDEGLASEEHNGYGYVNSPEADVPMQSNPEDNHIELDQSDILDNSKHIERHFNNEDNQENERRAALEDD